MTRSVYRHAALARLLHPASIAIIGASPTPGSFGARTLGNLARFQGRIYPVNAKYRNVGELTCYPSIDALPEAPDAVVITTPRESVEPLVQACIAKNAGGIVLYASGYAETAKPERIAAQLRLAALARESGVPLIGPNCIGVVNYLNDAAMTFSGLPRSAQPHAATVGIISQSGALGFAMAQAVERGMAISHVLTAGNSADVDVADQVAYLADDPGCKVIACIFEGMAQPLRFIEAAAIAWRVNKPLVVYKVATSEQGATAAMSHTGSLAGSQMAYRSAFERAGVIIVDHCEALMETAAFFAKAPAPTARGVAVVATSGGAAIMAADQAERHGVPLPQPSAAVRAVLEAHIPEFGSARNPCDVTAQVLANPQSIGVCGDALMSDAAYGAIVIPQVYSYDPAIPRIKTFSDLAEQHGKMTCNVWVTEWLEGPGVREAERAPRMALFRSMDRCFAALAAWHRREEHRRRPPRVLRRASDANAKDTAAALISAAKHTTLVERQAKQVLAAYGIPVVAERIVHSPDAALRAAHEIGLPVALKIESPDLPHKTEADVVRLNLRTDAAVRAAYDEILSNAQRNAPRAKVDGVLVQPMIGAGVEVIIGARVDPLFGPLIVVGLGGILVEVMQDSALALAPVTHDEAHGLLASLKGAALLQGFRGRPAVDQDRLADLVQRASELVADLADAIVELDVNPLICSTDRMVAVDALIVRRSPND
ncbi:MAG: CoA-binding protein [Betaproteobacteria bacterium]|nr:CoA-binding protein [Betaproteobacteria bacterium]